MRVAILGGSGDLGRSLQPLLDRAGHETVVASRNSDTPVDLSTGEGLVKAIDGSHVVVHLASNARSPEDTDIAGTVRLLEAIGGQHVIYMSIVGVDRHPFGYYQAKYRAEQLIADSGHPHTILRATQFHSFLEFILSKLCRRRMAIVPSGFVFQPIDINEVAAELARLVEEQPAGLQPDLAGPEVLSAEYLARTFMEARGREAPLMKIPVPGAAGRAFREGVHTNPDRAVGTVGWSDYLNERFS